MSQSAALAKTQPTPSLKEERQRQAKAWFEDLRNQICKAFEDIEDEYAKVRREQLLRDAINEIGGALETHKGAYRLPLSVLLYRQRE